MNDRLRISIPSGLSRRTFLGGALAGAGFAALAGCSTPLAAGLVAAPLAAGTLQYWNLFGGGDGVRQQQMLDGFQKAYPKVGLEATTWAWGNPYYTKLALATVGDKPPDVAVSHLTRMKTLVEAGLLTELKPADLARHGLSAEHFTPRVWEAGLVDGKVYSIPLDTHPQVMFYNTDICKKAGLLNKDGSLVSMDGEGAFADALERTQKVTGQFGATSPVNGFRVFATLYAQLGGKHIVDDGGTKVVIDKDRALKVFTYWRSLTVEKKLIAAIEYQASIATFATGASAFHFNGEWEITTFQTAKMPFSMTLWPNVFGGPYAVQADSHTFVLPKQQHDQAQLDKSLTFIKAMLDQSLTWSEGGHIPAWQPTLTSPGYANLTPQSNYAAAADGAIYDDPGWYSGSGSNFENIVGASMGAVEQGQLSPEAALAQMIPKLTVLANTPSPV
ncbi:extracellular solute-binding protein [Pengzhenrongella sp.]|jgi:multiple sugar transport system substrate-binding protein|uniref:extracellular solute-binding protein n=1 Tax=Pengzhenrongella sp. TaxID=2888820 RepID=UPI002F956434